MRTLGMKPHLARIRVYPIKSLDPLEVERVGLASGVRLARDRDYALFDTRGRFLNAKRLGPKILAIRAAFSDQARAVQLVLGSDSGRFELPGERAALEAWFGRALGQAVSLGQGSAAGFPDDEDASGPTVIGSATIDAVAEWFGLAAEEVRRRFRANLEIAGLGPFEEDTLFGPPGKPKAFRIGEVSFLGVNPCRRCVVPTLDSGGDTAVGALSPKEFSRLRERHRRSGTSLSLYPGYYRLAVNTRIEPPQAGARLVVGDELTVFE
ncbi:MAG: MOSC domain-containing protein [Acidobacteriia bacterium]|nr:MOSC domain-containing protein [Terriglobia bacterium]MYG04679.1 MOSC domain-containing protein [Terriglobia bacterium]MYK10654.1 MOSC domain-containing protein [Terriglobia bacterium]